MNNATMIDGLLCVQKGALHPLQPLSHAMVPIFPSFKFPMLHTEKYFFSKRSGSYQLTQAPSCHRNCKPLILSSDEFHRQYLKATVLESEDVYYIIVSTPVVRQPVDLNCRVMLWHLQYTLQSCPSTSATWTISNMKICTAVWMH